MSKLKTILAFHKNFGLAFTIKYINAYIYMLIFGNKKFLYKVQEWYIEKKFSKLIEKSKIKTNVGTEADDYKIWICWFQGEEEMPDVVKLCYKNLCNKLNSKTIVLVTIKNLKDYIDLPDYLYYKYNKGIILPAHFSDIIRCSLLAKYGGMWIDSTIFVTENIKQHLDIFESKFFTHKINGMDDKKHYSKYRWGPFLLGTKYKNNDVMKLMYEFLKEYWKIHDMAISYCFWDYIIGILYKNNVLFQQSIDNNKENNLQLHYFSNKLNEKVNVEEFNSIISNNYFLKLTYKEYVDFNDPNTNFAKLKEIANL